MSTVLSETAQQIINDAYQLAGRKDMFNELEPEEIEFGLRLLNDLIKQWQSRGVELSSILDVEVPLYDSKQSYVLGPSGDLDIGRPMRVVSARRRDSSGYDLPFEPPISSREDYKRLPLKDSAGVTVMAAYERRLTDGLVYVWPVSDTASTALTTAWTDSVAVPGEYHYTGAGVTAEPTYVFANGTKLTEGTLGSLADGEWAYGDNDSIGSSQLYVKLAVGNPGALATGHVKVLLTTPPLLILTIQRAIDIFDTSEDTPDLPSECLLALKYGLAGIVTDGSTLSLNERQMIKQQAIDYFNQMRSTDQEAASIYIHPRMR